MYDATESVFVLNKADVLDEGSYTGTFETLELGKSLPVVHRIIITLDDSKENGDFAGIQVETSYFITDRDGNVKPRNLGDFTTTAASIMGYKKAFTHAEAEEAAPGFKGAPVMLNVRKSEGKDGNEYTNVTLKKNHRA